MSDIHGCYEELLKALIHWDRETETLIVLGDLVDRGPDSLKVVQTLCDLKEKYPGNVVVLQGNHDESFAKWLLETHEEDLSIYYMSSHNETIKSFFGNDPDGIRKYKKSSRKQRGLHIRYLYMKEIRFLYNLPLYHETDHCIFVHAGINLDLLDWRLDMRCMNMIRNQFIYSRMTAPKTVFFGHTPTSIIRNVDKNEIGANDVWCSEHRDKVGIDGGVSMGGQLNALKVDEFGNITEIIAISPDKPEVHLTEGMMLYWSPRR